MERTDKFLEKYGVVVDFKISHTTYCYGDYRIEISFDLGNSEYGYWLYHKSCGIKAFMHGASMNEISYLDFLHLVFSGLKDDINFYDEEYDY